MPPKTSWLQRTAKGVFRDLGSESIQKCLSRSCVKILKKDLENISLNFSTLTNVVSFEVILVFLTLSLDSFGDFYLNSSVYTRISQKKIVLVHGDILQYKLCWLICRQQLNYFISEKTCPLLCDIHI